MFAVFLKQPYTKNVLFYITFMEENMLKAMDLFTAYKQDQLPKEEGYIVSSFFSYDSPYTIYEVISYSGVKAIYATDRKSTRLNSSHL